MRRFASCGRAIARSLCLLALPLWAATPVNIKAGAMWCGAIKRDVYQVQTWCYSPSNVVVENGVHNLAPIDPPELVYTYNFAADIVTWKFSVDASQVMHYEVTANGGAVKSGILQ